MLAAAALVVLVAAAVLAALSVTAAPQAILARQATAAATETTQMVPVALAAHQAQAEARMAKVFEATRMSVPTTQTLAQFKEGQTSET